MKQQMETLNKGHEANVLLKLLSETVGCNFSHSNDGWNNLITRYYELQKEVKETYDEIEELTSGTGQDSAAPGTVRAVEEEVVTLDGEIEP